MNALTAEIKLLTQTALPLMATFLSQKGIQVIDTIMMGWISPEALAAGALSASVFMTVLVFCMGTFSAVGIFISRARGANQQDDIRRNLQCGMLLAVLLSFPCTFIIWHTPQLLLMMGENPKIVENTALLLRGWVYGLPGFLLFLVFRELVSAFGLARIVMWVTLCAIPLTFLANYILIYGKYGIPPLGIAGIGYAGAGIMWIMFFGLFFYSRKHPSLKSHIRSLRSFKLALSPIAAMFSLGVSTGLMYVLDMGMFSLATIMMGYFGVSFLAAHQIALQYTSIAYAIPFALSMATALQVSHAIGANNFSQAKRFIVISVCLGLSISACVTLLFLFTPEMLIHLFLKSGVSHYQETFQFAISLLAIAALLLCFDALQAIINGALRGLKDTFIPMLWCVACYWIIGIGSAYYFAFHTALGAKGIWYGLTVGLCSVSLILLLRFLQKKAVISFSEKTTFLAQNSDT